MLFSFTKIQLALLFSLLLGVPLSSAIGCPYANHGSDVLSKRQDGTDKDRLPGDDGYLDKFYVNDTDVYTTTDFGTPVADRVSLKAGERGPTLLEDFVLRTKITRFDHERVPERAVHARGAAAHGYFESYADWSNITAASFLGKARKQTPVFVRFSTVAGSRGSADSVRDIRGFATRFYTDAGNLDVVGNDAPVFFIQDAMQFPDLIHSVKPRQDNEIPQAATAHDSAWDFFSQNPSTMHTLMWALSGPGIPRSFRHMPGFGVHTFRFVNDDGESKLIKWHFTPKLGKAAFVWPEAQTLAGMNSDFHRQDLYDSIERKQYPEWEVGVQIVDEKDMLSYGFDMLDPTKFLPEELVPVTPLGKLVLNRNPRNFFAETEQVMMNPGHVVRGIDFSDDPLLQGRLFSYVDTQINRHGGPNFEQVPINQPHVPVHNNNRDGAGQGLIHLNIIAYGQNSLNNGSPKLANRTQGKGFFTAPARMVVDGAYVRDVSPTFMDFWSQPRMYWNSLVPAEQQMLVNAARFELSKVTSVAVRENVIRQFNLIDNGLATRVAAALGIAAPKPDPKFYHNNSTAYISYFRNPLLSVEGLNVAILASVNSATSMEQAKYLYSAFEAIGAHPIIIGEIMKEGVDQAYVSANAVLFDGIIATDGTKDLFTLKGGSTYFPSQVPGNLFRDGYAYGKPIAAIGNGKAGLELANVATKGEKGVYIVGSTERELKQLVKDFESGLKTFKFLNRFAMDKEVTQS
ncbi:catalase-domain-containing protein [Terfezia boudieri ATCC MYA-4762]|uniref:Catalase n=1 Tax=Terfezia boudieri ATCC MYA-4762 TaxID=1051890 RepID=A0A3N4LZ25_9PEZI|nr:catalase-domain-containing protein [Terfezia boudieri ATCC MYA-4762]